MLKAVEKTEFTIAGSPDRSPLLGGAFYDVRKQGGLNFLTQNMLKYGDLIPFHLGPTMYVQLNHPELIKYVLQNHEKYDKSPTYRFYKDIIGNGLLTSFGEKWKRDRRIAQPAFDRQYVEGFYSRVVQQVVDGVKEEWLKAARTNTPVNITKSMSHITMNVILKTMFSAQVMPEDVEHVDAAINTFMDYVAIPRIVLSVNTFRFTRPFLHQRVQKEIGYMDNLVFGLITRRRKEPGDHEDMLSYMINARDEDGSALNDQDIRDHIMNMIFAGYETTAVSLQWMWFTQSKFPDIATRLRAEMATLPSNASFKQVDELPLLEMTIKEIQRLYPPFWTTARQPVVDDVIGGYAIKKGTPVILPQYAIHRLPNIWKNPEGFVPERFTPEEEAKRHPYSYFPFSLGPRKCAGWRFAMMEAKMVLFNLLPMFDVELVPGQTGALRAVVTLRLKDDLMMRVYRR